MIEMLRSQWNESMTFPRLIELCASIDGMFQQRRPTDPSLPPSSRCPKCGRIVTSESFGRHRIRVKQSEMQGLRSSDSRHRPGSSSNSRKSPLCGRCSASQFLPPVHWSHEKDQFSRLRRCFNPSADVRSDRAEPQHLLHGEGQEGRIWRSEEHTSELQSLAYLVCRLLLEKKKK